jgi:hypothetical protein
MALITNGKCKLKQYLNPRWGISFKLGQILWCILKKGEEWEDTLGTQFMGRYSSKERRRVRSREGRRVGGERLGVREERRMGERGRSSHEGHQRVALLSNVAHPLPLRGSLIKGASRSFGPKGSIFSGF